MAYGFVNIKKYVDAYDEGRSHTCSFRKVPSQASVAGHFVDLSMAAGNPVPNYYASTPLESAKLSGFKGIFHGDDKSPAKKFLTKLGIIGASTTYTSRILLLDYLMYYPFIDGDSTDEQIMDNTTSLDRYADGNGVRAMLVAVAPTLGGGSFTYNYINQNGDAKTSPIISCNVAAAGISTIATSEQATVAGGSFFLPMADGDTGIRQITSQTMLTSSGGLFSLVLVKPLIDSTTRENATMEEIDLLINKPYLVEIKDDAYLNFVVCGMTSVASTNFVGYANFVWSE